MNYWKLFFSEKITRTGKTVRKVQKEGTEDPGGPRQGGSCLIVKMFVSVFLSERI